MGKMKQEFEKFYSENPDMSDAEYQDWLYSQGYEPVTMEDKITEHDASVQVGTELVNNIVKPQLDKAGINPNN